MSSIRAMPHDAHPRPIHAVRWRNFRRLLESEAGTITAAAQRLGKPQGQVSHFGGKKPTKVIGDQIASEIETAFNLPRGSMDVEQADYERFIPPTESSQNSDVRQSRNLILDPAILAEAVKVVEIDEEIAGSYPPLKHAELLLDLYGRIAKGADPMKLVAELTHKRRDGNDGQQGGGSA